MRKKLIEVALPLEAINRESARERSIRHGHPSPARPGSQGTGSNSEDSGPRSEGIGPALGAASQTLILQGQL
jgi:hypothetical protein